MATGSLIENDIKSMAGGTVEHRDINAVEVKEMETAARTLSIEIHVQDARLPEQYPNAFVAVEVCGGRTRISSSPSPVMSPINVTLLSNSPVVSRPAKEMPSLFVALMIDKPLNFLPN